MNGVLLCKFDEERGYVPVKVFPPKVRKRKNIEIFKEIARNAIGFGTQVDFQAFSFSGINCLAKRFSISDAEARGGSVLYALVIFSGDSEEFDKGLLGESTNKIVDNWGGRSDIMKSLYYSFNPEEVAEVPISTPIPAPSTPSRPLLPKELFIEKIGFFADESVLTRNLVMLLSFLAIFWVFYSRYDFITFCFMFVIGVFAFVLVAKKDKTQKITSYMLFFFIILLIIRFSFELIGDISTITFFLGTFPDFSRPDLILLSFSSGILTCIGLDRGNAVDKRSFIIGICSVVFLIIFFLTPLFEMLLAYFRGL